MPGLPLVAGGLEPPVEHEMLYLRTGIAGSVGLPELHFGALSPCMAAHGGIPRQTDPRLPAIQVA